MKQQVLKTGLGYFTKNGKVISKFELPKGPHKFEDDVEVVEVETREDLSQVEVYVEKPEDRLPESERYAYLRQQEYPSTSEMVVALWEKLVENRPEALEALQAKREAVKQKNPKANKRVKTNR